LFKVLLIFELVMHTCLVGPLFCVPLVGSFYQASVPMVGFVVIHCTLFSW